MARKVETVNCEPLRVLIYAVSVRQGGVEEYLLNLYRMLDRNRIQFDFIVVGEGGFYAHDEVEKLGGELYYLSKESLFSIMKRERPRHQVLYFNVCAWYRPQPLVFARIMGYKCIISHAHNTRDTSRSSFLSTLHCINRVVARTISKRCFACSELAGYWIYGKGFFTTSDKCQVIPNAIELNRFKYNEAERKRIREENGIPNDSFVAIQIGRMTYQKNQAFTLGVFSELCKLMPEKTPYLLMVGDGEERCQLENIVELEGANNRVKFLGTRSDVPSLLSASDVLMLPSRYEGLVVVGVESQASGLPTLVSDKVTDELGMTELVRYLPIDSMSDPWIQEIVQLADNPELCQRRKESDDAIEKLREYGYDSERLAAEMGKLFSQLSSEDGI